MTADEEPMERVRIKKAGRHFQRKPDLEEQPKESSSRLIEDGAVTGRSERQRRQEQERKNKRN